MARKKLTLTEIKALAKSRGGKCLSSEYVNIHAPLHWECAKGHRWWISTDSIKSKGSWCRRCAASNRKGTIEEMQQLAKANGGKCLSTEYTNAATPLQWECSKGHIWLARPNSIKSKNTWCPDCSWPGLQKPTIDEMQEIARSRGGKCLSTEYINSRTKLQWECAKGHTWWGDSDSIKSSASRCPKCLKGTIEEMREIARSRGGKCLSKEYKNAHTHLQWMCNKGHSWLASPSSVKHSESWCAECAEVKKLTIKQMQDLAISKGGKCLSTEYINRRIPLKWQCYKGHIWEDVFPHIMRYRNFCQICRREEQIAIKMKKIRQGKMRPFKMRGGEIDG